MSAADGGWPEHLFGHRFLYDRSTLEAAVRQAGFDQVAFAAPGESAHPALRGVDRRPLGPEARANAYESLVVEARKPLW